MNERLSLSISTILHGALLAMLSLISFRQVQKLPEPPGMELEIIDVEHAMPLPDPSVAQQLPTSPVAEQAAAPQPLSPLPLASPTQQTIVQPQPQPQPQSQPQPQLRSVPAMPLQPAPKPMETKALGVGPVAPPAKPAPLPPQVAAVAPAPAAAPAAASPPAPPRPRINAQTLSRTIAARVGQAAQTRLNSSTIGSAIGKATPKGASGLTVRQRANLEDMIRSQITPCWNPPMAEDGVGRLSVVMRIQLDRSGAVSGSPSITAIKGQTAANAAYARALGGSVRRAVLRCSPLRLPPELFDAWSDVELNFDPRDVS